MSDSQTPVLEAIRYSRGSLSLLDQKRLPMETIFEDCLSVEDGWNAIREMKVRGAPAIAIAAALSLAVEAQGRRAGFSSPREAAGYLASRLEYLATSRPTAVNLFQAVDALKRLVEELARSLPSDPKGAQAVIDAYLDAAEEMLRKDLSDNQAIGRHGAALFHGLDLSLGRRLRVLTHCNTGSLATAGFGTALGVIRSLRDEGLLEHAFCTETRPYNQGARLTAYELVYEKIPATLLTDSMAAFLMRTRGIDGVIVGADRVARNGDTANKIGTYQLAIAAHHHGIPFYVAAPSTSIDLGTASGASIPIEERPAEELTHLFGRRFAAPGIGVWNPGFDVTPAYLISGIITERGVARRASDGRFDLPQFLREPV